VPDNVHFVGPILAGNTTEAIPPTLQAVLDGAGDGGAVLVSFGTSLSLDPAIYRTVAAGLAALDPPAPVIWKLAPSDLGGADPASIFPGATSPPHITLLPWIPQNALLQSGRIAAFLTHGGANSLYEAAFHGVPVAGLPFFGDALDNVAKAVSRGFGISLGRPAALTPGKVAGALGALRADPRYRSAARAASTRLVARPGPARAVAADIVQRETEDYWAVREVSGGGGGVTSVS
jgi:glucuronosyltransferase